MTARAIEFALVFFCPADTVRIYPPSHSSHSRTLGFNGLVPLLSCFAIRASTARNCGTRHRSPNALPSILGLFAVGLGIAIVTILRYRPDLFLSLPRKNPALWGLIMLAYPVLSVYPQGIVFRAFIFERYRGLFTADWAIVLASALAFSYIHIVFRNSLALALTLLGGLSVRATVSANRFTFRFFLRTCALRLRDIHNRDRTLVLPCSKSKLSVVVIQISCPAFYDSTNRKSK